MARIRTVKPEFWTSEQVVDCHRDTRLLFVGMWNFCDDSGVHPANCKRLKMEVFPGDEDINSSNIRRMVDELIANDLVSEFSVNEKSYWIVHGWKHQKIDQPTFRFPTPNGSIPSTPPRRKKEDSANVRPANGEHSVREGMVKEGKGKDVDGDIGAASASGDPDYEQDQTKFCNAVINIFQKHWNTRPPCNFPTIQKIIAHAENYPNARHLGWWDWYFAFALTDGFLSGVKVPSFVANLSYLLKPDTLAAVIESGQRAALTEATNG